VQQRSKKPVKWVVLFDDVEEMTPRLALDRNVEVDILAMISTIGGAIPHGVWRDTQALSVMLSTPDCAQQVYPDPTFSYIA
jgi:hypothetical protein